jgi:acyl carrier protein
LAEQLGVDAEDVNLDSDISNDLDADGMDML